MEAHRVAQGCKLSYNGEVVDIVEGLHKVLALNSMLLTLERVLLAYETILSWTRH